MQANQIRVVAVAASFFWLFGALVFFVMVAGVALTRSRSPAGHAGRL